MRLRQRRLTELGLALMLVAGAPPVKSEEADCPVGIECISNTWRIESNTRVVLLGAVKRTLDSLVLGDGAIVETQGKNLELNIRDKLSVEGDATIRAYDPAAIPGAPAKAADGSPGSSFDPGPANGDGAGRSGGPGGSGGEGTLGAPGPKAGTITVIVGGAASGTLQIVNRGGTGGRGGEGGDGGSGGTGEQGTRAVTNYITVVGNRVPAGCASGPGFGGPGGPGGDGGRGGKGGPGGDGGVVVLKLPNNELKISVLVTGGDGGPGGAPGRGGLGAKAGFGGRGNVLCEGKEGDRSGQDSLPGKPRNADDLRNMSGFAGDSGHAGTEVRL